MQVLAVVEQQAEAFATACSKSASAKMMLATSLLPVTGCDVARRCLMICRPTAVEPVGRDHLHVRVGDHASPTTCPGPVITFSAPAGSPAAAKHSQTVTVVMGVSEGVEHDAVAHGQRRADLEHRQEE